VVKLIVNDIIPNSVFAEISVPTLKANPNIQLEFVNENE